MRITEPRDLYETKQIVPTRQLLQLAEKWGFEHRSSGTSHHHCHHKIHTDILFNIMGGTKRLSSQRNLADAMVEIERRELEKQKEIQNVFSAASENRLDNIRAQLPPHVTAELTQNGNVVLRDVQVPQLGVTLYSDEQDKMLESYLRYEFGHTKNAFYAELNKLRSKHDAEAVFDDKGNFTGKINHIVYGAEYSLEMPVYQEGGNGGAFIHAFEDYRERIELKDMEQAFRKEALLDRPFLGNLLIRHSEQRGERHNHVRITDPRAGDLRLSFTTFSNQRVAGDGSRGRITDDELGVMAWKIKNIEKRIAASHQAPAPMAAVA